MQKSGRSSGGHGEGVDARALQPALDAAFRDSLPTLTAVAAGIFAVLVPANRVLLDEPLAITMAWASGTTAAVLLTLFAFARAGRIPAKWAHPVGGFIGALALANATYPAIQRGDLYLTTDFMLIIVGAGMFLLSHRWHLLVVGATTATWMAFAVTAAPSPLWIHFALAMLFSVALSTAVHAVRVNTTRRLETHLREESRHADALRANVRSTSASEDRYRRLAQGAFESIIILDREGVADTNPAAGRMFGYPDGDLAKLDVLDLVAPVSRDAVDAHLQRANGDPLTVVGRRCGGRIFPVEVRVRRLGGPDEGAVAVAMREVPLDDIAALEDAEEAPAPDASGDTDAEEDDDAPAAREPTEAPWVRRLMREMREYTAGLDAERA